MNLTPEQQAILNGEKGEVLAKVMKTLVMYGDAFGAEKLVPVTSKYGHTVISFGINTMKPGYDLYAQGLRPGGGQIATRISQNLVLSHRMFSVSALSRASGQIPPNTHYDYTLFHPQSQYFFRFFFCVAFYVLQFRCYSSPTSRSTLPLSP